ncbi:MAG: hypothetical protein JXM69_04340 [Anaerolineae bacterium]|nr:hypothetical protein [Anaerolineae bacterium]
MQWGYTDAPVFVDEAQRQMREMVEPLYNHPGIVVTNLNLPWLPRQS